MVNKNRLKFAKKMFKGYFIIFGENNEITRYKNINHIIIDKNNNVIINKYENNNYYRYKKYKYICNVLDKMSNVYKV